MDHSDLTLSPLNICRGTCVRGSSHPDIKQSCVESCQGMLGWRLQLCKQRASQWHLGFNLKLLLRYKKKTTIVQTFQDWKTMTDIKYLLSKTSGV